MMHSHDHNPVVMECLPCVIGSYRRMLEGRRLHLSAITAEPKVLVDTPGGMGMLLIHVIPSSLAER